MLAMSSVQLASITLETAKDGTSVRGVLEWRKNAGYAAYLTDVAADGTSLARDVIVAHDVPAGLRELAELVAAHLGTNTDARPNR
jgi:hypothetical protein